MTQSPLITLPKKKYKNKLEKILDTELQEVQYIGEDGGMIVDGRLPFEEAYRRMRARWVEDCGEEDAKDFFDEYCTEEAVGRASLLLATKKIREKYGEPDLVWYVSIKEESDYKVWCYWA